MQKYYVSFDNNFVKHRTYQEPLYGLNERVWSFKIERKYIVNFSHFKIKKSNHCYGYFFKSIFKIVVKESKYSDSVTERVRLTSEGTEYFEHLNDIECKDFYAKLK